MRLLHIILATIAATSAMTAFSYFLSAALKKQFKEPVLLTEGLASLKIIANRQTQVQAAWAIHYLIGLFFIISYDLTWNNTRIDPTWFSGILLGIVSGIIGILGWKLIFKLMPMVPRISFNMYFIQLFLAHIVFALVAVLVYYVIPGN